MTKICPLCKGFGQTKHLVKHHQTGKPVTVIDWCLCKKASLISSAPALPILSGLGDTYLPIDQIDPQLTMSMEDLSKTPNFLVLSETPYDSFLLHIKSFIMVNKFREESPSIYACDSIDLLKKFYVAQEDGTCPSLAAVNKYDLLIFTMGVDEKNEQLKTCVAQVVSNRKSIKKPTWIYLKRPYDACIWEKSEVLSQYLELGQDKPVVFKRINLRNLNQNVNKTLSKAKKAADSFKL